MSRHHASCRCGQLRATASGHPVRVSVCHCLNCQKRSGSAFAVQARWPGDMVVVEGRSGTFAKTGNSGNVATFHFCPDCGSDVFFLNDGPSVHPAAAESIAIPLGAFDDPHLAAPQFSVWESRKHEWLEIRGDGIHHD